MKAFHLFFTLVFIFGNAQAQMPADRRCLDLFVHWELKPFTELRSELQSWELKRTGLVYSVKSSDSFQTEGLFQILQLLRERDGTFPLLMDKQGNLIISHRLPSNRPEPGAAYLGTHRGLYLEFKEKLGHEPQIVFAGQLRVIAGKTVSLVDQAGTFYDMEADMTGDSSQTSLYQQLVESNQKRIDFANAQLQELGISDAKTVIFNFRKRSGRGAPQGPADGHVVAKDAADFEIRCRANPPCWNKFLKIESYLKKISNLGGMTFLESQLPLLLQEQRSGVFDLIQIMGMITAEGTLDVMAMEQMQETGTSRGQMFQNFYELLDPVLAKYVD